MLNGVVCSWWEHVLTNATASVNRECGTQAVRVQEDCGSLTIAVCLLHLSPPPPRPSLPLRYLQRSRHSLTWMQPFVEEHCVERRIDEVLYALRKQRQVVGKYTGFPSVSTAERTPSTFFELGVWLTNTT